MSVYDSMTINNDTRDLSDKNAVKFSEAQSLTSAQKSTARGNIGAPPANGSAPDLTAGFAENLVPPITENTVPYNFRTPDGPADILGIMYDKLVGGTLAWNQLVDTGTTAVTIQSGRKYVAFIGGTWTCAQSAGTALSVTGGTDMVFDLTQMFGTAIANYVYGLEQATPGAGVAWFRKLFPENYYAYDAGSLQSVQAASHETTGFNQWDEVWEVGTISSTTGQDGNSNTSFRSKNYIPVFPSTVYNGHYGSGYGDSSTGSRLYPRFYDADKKYLGTANSVIDGTFSTPANCRYMRFVITKSVQYNNDICINLSWSGYRNGEYEPYVKHSYALDDSLTLRGFPKLDAANNLYYDGDTYESDGTVTRRYEQRAYQSGDENLADAITDGTNTVVKLATPTTESADPFQSPQVVDDFGTEEYTDAGVIAETRDVAIPVGHVTQYPANLRDKLRHLPDLAYGDGQYVIQQSGEQMILVPGRIPAAPTSNGTYVLRVTVSRGNAVYSWVSAT